jgi:hypothetical protein
MQEVHRSVWCRAATIPSHSCVSFVLPWKVQNVPEMDHNCILSLYCIVTFSQSLITDLWRWCTVVTQCTYKHRTSKFSWLGTLNVLFFCVYWNDTFVLTLNCIQRDNHNCSGCGFLGFDTEAPILNLILQPWIWRHVYLSYLLQGSALGPLLFLLFINDIMKITNTKDNNNKSKLVLFKDDTSLNITCTNSTNFVKDINGVFTDINNWFKASFLSLNYQKTSLIQFLTKNYSH